MELEQKVILESASGKQEFSYQHALNVLVKQVGRSKALWWLPKGSEYQFKGNELIHKPNKGSGKPAKTSE